MDGRLVRQIVDPISKSDARFVRDLSHVYSIDTIQLRKVDGMASDYPVTLEIEYPESSSRLLALAAILFFIPKYILAIPHLIVLAFLGFVAMIAAFIGYWAVLITGKYPRGLFDFGVGVQRWNIRFTAWLLGWTDKYPPFGM